MPSIEGSVNTALLHSVEEWVRGGTPSVIALFITQK